MSQLTRCSCRLKDCHYYNAVSGGSESDCDCAHPDKQHYMFNPCPLYRKEWSQLDQDAIIERFKRKKD